MTPREINNMEDWKKRAAILIAVGLAFGVILFAVKSIRTDDEDALQSPESVKIEAEKKPATTASRPAVTSAPAAKPSPPIITPTPPNPRPRSPEERQAPPDSMLRQLQNAQSLYDALGGNAPQIAAFRALFRPPGSQSVGEATRAEVEIVVREYLDQYHSYLELSRSDYESLIGLVVSYRDNDSLLRSTRRTAENRELLRTLRAEMKGAMDEFRKIINPLPEDIFGEQTSAPPPFGR